MSRHRGSNRAFLILLWALTTGCQGGCRAGEGGVADGGVTDGGPTEAGPGDATVSGPVAVHMRLGGGGAFYDSPFPGEHRRDSNGRASLEGFPNPRRVPFVVTLKDILATQTDRDFALSASIYFSLTGRPDTSRLPDYAASLEPTAQVFLVAIDPESPAYLVRHPIRVRFQDDGGPFAARNFLSLLPLQGAPLRAHTRYAAVIRTGLRDPRGLPLLASDEVAALAAGRAVTGVSTTVRDHYRDALDALARLDVQPSDVAGLTVFRTGDPAPELVEFLNDALARPLPTLEAAPTRTDLFDTYCVYQSTVFMPVYQAGDVPYPETGGGWTRDAQGRPAVQQQEQARVVFAVPRTAMPASGFPSVVFVRTGGGGDRPMIDRGVRPAPGAAPLRPGEGPELEFARAGFAGVSWDGPHGGLRNITQADEQFLVFNVNNPLALRDNIRQSALETALLAHVLDAVRIDASDCPGVVVPGGGDVRFDTSKLALMGHSMGATIGPIALALEPRYRAAMFSGAGGSFIANIMYKQKPLSTRVLAESFLQYAGRMLREDDPALNLLQWAGEPADPPVYAARVLRETLGAAPRHVLMMQGIVDNYIPPPVANALSLSIGLDPAGTALDEGNPMLSDFTPVGTLAPLVGRARIALPASGNVSGTTAVVVQFAGDAIEDGHEAVFQTEPPKRAYRCFLESYARTGTPRVPARGAYLDPCE